MQNFLLSLDVLKLWTSLKWIVDLYRSSSINDKYNRCLSIRETKSDGGSVREGSAIDSTTAFQSQE